MPNKSVLKSLNTQKIQQKSEKNVIVRKNIVYFPLPKNYKGDFLMRKDNNNITNWQKSRQNKNYKTNKNGTKF